METVRTIRAISVACWLSSLSGIKFPHPTQIAGFQHTVVTASEVCYYPIHVAAKCKGPARIQSANIHKQSLQKKAKAKKSCILPHGHHAQKIVKASGGWLSFLCLAFRGANFHPCIACDLSNMTCLSLSCLATEAWRCSLVAGRLWGYVWKPVEWMGVICKGHIDCVWLYRVFNNGRNVWTDF